MQLVTAEQMQTMDRQTIESFGIPGRVLMENAGRGAVKLILDRYSGIEEMKIAVLAGRGNNGGDGFVIARYLMEKGIFVNTYLLSTKDKVQGDAKANMDLVLELINHEGPGAVIEIPDAGTLKKYRPDIRHHGLFVDAILGTGLNSDVRGFFKDAIELMNQSSAPVFSVDIPSGLHSDTGRPLGTAVKADATATFAFAKAGHILYPGNTFTGELEVIDIGIPDFIAAQQHIGLSIIEKAQVAGLIPVRSFNSHKGTFGHLGILAGSPGKTGAAALCANAAVRCGTGLVTLGVPQQLNSRIEPLVVEPMTLGLKDNNKGLLTLLAANEISQFLKDKQALALGPGIGTHKETVALVHNLVKDCRIPLVIDADGLNCVAEKPDILGSAQCPVVLTPHPGEMARLSGASTKEIQADRTGVAIDFAHKYNITLVLKGAQTVIASPDGSCRICPTGNPGMASGGMGDVLTGIIAGFCAQGLAPEAAAAAGVYIHGLCADTLADHVNDFGFTASDIVDSIPGVIGRELL